MTNTGGTIQVDDNATLLKLTSTTIDGGSVTIEDPVATSGTLTLISGSTIEDGALHIIGQVNVTSTGNAIDNETSFTVAHSGLLEVKGSGALTLSGDIVNLANNTANSTTGYYKDRQ